MGVTNYYLFGAEIARAMVPNSDRTVIFADHSNIGAPARSTFCTVSDIDRLITDAGVRQREGFEALVQAIPEFIVAG